MRIPIAHTLAWPERMATPSPRLDLASLGRLDFTAPDTVRFPALRLAREALRAGGGAPAILNAANEIAVEAFLQRRIGFLDIAGTVAEVLDAMGTPPADTLDEVRGARCRRPPHRGAPDRRTRRLRSTNRTESTARPCPTCSSSALAFLVVLGVLVFVHELGHYLAARWRGVHVEVFSIGFGPRDRHLARPRRHGLEARLAAARRLRQAARPGAAGSRGSDEPRSQACRPRDHALARTAAAVGQPVRTSRSRPDRWIAGRCSTRSRSARARSSSPPDRSPISCWRWCCSPLLFATAGRPVILPVAGEVLPDSAAARAGLQADDRIVAIDGDADRELRGHPAHHHRASGRDADHHGPARRDRRWTCRC